MGERARQGSPAGASQLAQVNVARLRHPAGSPQVRAFVAALPQINALAERAPGFVWRWPSGDGHLDGGELLGDPLVVVNLSVWERYEDLHDFVYRSDHARFVRGRSAWFSPLPPPTTALWWVPVGTRPTPEDAVARLRLLRRYGPSPQAFPLRSRFGPDGRPDPGRRPAGRSGRPPSPRSARQGNGVTPF